ncbi:MAG: cytochrome c maturation protein CcmE [Dokdonella sp.]|jgi:cytochrome c-type biogenesis protein CcmE|uniref:cytochrome c maturation protein CcmE n=1 Tax=Dokdonella sp. TaxID=2291710 RepID=UPI001B6EF68A|nr:cytochrome c maturation protein CcmE [Dokdonella sp.]MCC6441018.1 cytochrome c maturation protein CcmE [Rhodanobacteraceae bacterium]MBK8122535.1 cytochrome c maturation protein CcmE [Dokdonella sp.]MBP6327064.1 cytochrome c maturation protein CcmE [Dokdonella sp.]MBP6329605.1 cytochrome c maturation protein CcmE [Dokdonella sp.]HNV07929.1 cytochrome c maturation protein CcmE [Dokdonella sp.]
MTPTRKRRLIMIGAILIAAAAATTLIVLALQQNMTYLFTPSEILAGKVPDGARFRIGGMVKQGSVERGQSLTVAFVVTDGDGDMRVEYNGILPDLFRDNQSVIATGSMQGNHFLATEVLAKHDENYVPRDVAEAMSKAHRKHDVPVEADKPTP